MVQFNPKLPDDSVNIREESPLKDLFLLVPSIVCGVVLLVFVVGFTLDIIIPYIPISVEQKIFSSVIDVGAKSLVNKSSGSGSSAFKAFSKSN